ncbi:MAG: ATP-binding protein [Halovenus sp.]
MDESIRVLPIPTAIVRVDRSGEIAFVNDRARSILGFDGDGPLERTYDDPDWESRDLDGEPIPDEELPFRRVLASGEPVDGYRHSIRCADGVRRIVEVSGAPLFDGQGDVEGVVFALSDATPRRRRETAFEALHEIATTIQREQTVEAVCERTVTAAADILQFDTCSIVIREGEWLVPYAVSENTPPDGVQRMRTDEGLAGKTFQSGESEIVERVPDNDDVNPAKESYRSGISVPIGEYGVFQAVSTTPEAFADEDIEFAELLLSHTENKIEQLEREAELRRQNERLDEFAGIVSHDLSNPLNVAQLQLELVRESVDDERLAAVARAHDRMETLIDALLTLARSRNPVSETARVDLAAVAAQSLATLDTDCVALSTESAAFIEADEDLVTILLENLLKNSAEHGCDGTGRAADTVAVRVGLLDDGFFFEDDGAGVPEEIREEIFDVGVSTGPDGTGIGLKIVTEIVDAHGWAIDVTESEDGGARFEITGVSIDG